MSQNPKVNELYAVYRRSHWTDGWVFVDAYRSLLWARRKMRTGDLLVHLSPGDWYTMDAQRRLWNGGTIEVINQ